MFMPFRTQELYDAGGIYYGTNRLSRNVIFVNRKRLSNHNALALGQSGKGKSTINKLAILATRLNEPEDQVIVIDPQSEYHALCHALDGTLITFDAVHDFYINPMDADFSDADYAREQEIAAEKSDFILSLLQAV